VDPDCQWDGRFFDPEKKTERWEELEGPWTKFGPFDQAMDYFGDGSFWIIQAPGHMPGNLCAAVRLEGGEWVLLGSDCCHSRCVLITSLHMSMTLTVYSIRELFDGVHEIAVWQQADGTTASLQADVCAAKDTIARIRVMEQHLKVHVAFAHDASWMKEGTDQVLMSLLNPYMKDIIKERLALDEAL
jgi:glyoxylase-like metal-dependent hydrolase (beta-lactamase superfamily II)